jgi:hypothetical protein
MKGGERPGQGWDKCADPLGESEEGTSRERKGPDRRVPDEPTLRPVRDLGVSASVPCLLPVPGLSPIRAQPTYDRDLGTVKPKGVVLSHFRRDPIPARPQHGSAR